MDACIKRFECHAWLNDLSEHQWAGHLYSSPGKELETYSRLPGEAEQYSDLRQRCWSGMGSRLRDNA